MKVGEVAKALGISHELIRYYVEEGLISPQKNEVNGYYEYTSEEIVRLQDIIFYRNHQLSIKDIKIIMNNTEVHDIGHIISSKKSSMIKEIKNLTESLYNLDQWETLYKKEIYLLNHYVIDEMPLELRCGDYIDNDDDIAYYIDKFFDLNRVHWTDIYVSAYIDFNEKDPALKKYLSLPEHDKIHYSIIKGNVSLEKENKCLITETDSYDHVMDTICDMKKYAYSHNINLNGKFYIRENTSYYKNRKRYALYKIFAVIA